LSVVCSPGGLRKQEYHPSHLHWSLTQFSQHQIIGFYIGLLEEWTERFLKCHLFCTFFYSQDRIFAFRTAYIESYSKCWAYRHNNPIISLISGSCFAEMDITDNTLLIHWQQVRFAFICWNSDVRRELIRCSLLVHN